MDQPSGFDQWVIVELFGHQQIAGRVSEQAIGGSTFIRVDVPECGEISAFTKFYGAGAIYAITPVGEDVARAYATRCLARPISAYEMRMLGAGSSGRRDHAYDDDLETSA